MTISERMQPGCGNFFVHLPHTIQGTSFEDSIRTHAFAVSYCLKTDIFELIRHTSIIPFAGAKQIPRLRCTTCGKFHLR
jgi:hypothetical protein